METPIISGGDGAAPQADDLIKDTDTAQFMADVIDASRQAPVIVDFWAPWCGPCKQLTPLLEQTVKAARGAVRMVKINVDENPEIAAQMRVQSIPAVFAFKDGQPVDGFMGALPESQIKSFVEKLAGGPVGDQEAEAMVEAGKQAFEASDFAAAANAFGEALRRDRENVAAIAGLAKCQIASGDLDGARATLGLVPPAKEKDPDVVSAKAALELAETPTVQGESAELEAAVAQNPDDHQSRLDLAVALNAEGRREEALDHLIHIIKTDREWNDDAARLKLLQFFEAWGFTDPISVSGRRKLSSILFS
ncbi:MAG: thioredoxin [Hyphomicrobiales bacterium]